MKTRNINTVIFCLLIILYSRQVYSQTNIAFLVNNKQNLTSRENTVKTILTDNGYSVLLMNYNEANFDNLKGLLFTVATDKGAISSDLTYLLIFGGKKVILLYDSAEPLGGSWSQYDSDEARSLYVESREAFLQDYVKGANFLVQQSGWAPYIYGNDYPSGWQIIGCSYGNAKTALYRTHTSGGKGVIFTYDANYFTLSGDTVFKKIVFWSSSPTGVISEPLFSIPLNFSLSQNYPNPFNNISIIHYELNKDVHVSLEVYDICGKKVLTLLDKYQAAGYYNIKLTADKMTSGLYFYKLRAGDFVESKRMLLLK